LVRLGLSKRQSAIPRNKDRAEAVQKGSTFGGSGYSISAIRWRSFTRREGSGDT
jgi:hypothetical protein